MHWRSDLPILPPASIAPPVNYEDIITIEASKRGGKPCIRGLRITVYDVLDYLAGGMTEQEILADFPDLTAEDLKACLAFAADRGAGVKLASAEFARATMGSSVSMAKKPKGRWEIGSISATGSRR
jgi:uncharacterized protein (DUF433 family)